MKKIKTITHSIFFASVTGIGLLSCDSNSHKTQEAVTLASIDQKPKIEGIIGNWPEKSQEVAREIVKKYGDPAEMTDTRLIWFNCGPWKRTIVYKEEVPHHFPKKHVDVLEQTIGFQYPVEKYDELTAYDGSVYATRTMGELSARCDKEAMNFLAINLANDVAKGNLTVEKARMEYAKNVKDFMEGKNPKSTQGFTFALPKGNQGDPGESIMDKVTATNKKNDKSKN